MMWFNELRVSEDHHIQHWKTEDIIDFEYYRMMDEGVSGKTLEIRDRAVFQGYGKTGAGRQQLFRLWLDTRRKEQVFAFTPGVIAKSVFSFVAILISVAGLIAGSSIAYGTLQYDGSVPVNVSVFLGVLVIPQVILMIALIGLLLVGMFYRKSVTILYRIPTTFVMALCRIAWNTFRKFSHLSAENRDNLQWSAKVFSGLVGQTRGVMSARAFGLVQQFGVFFNLGVLLCSGILLMFSDRAFGWQSSLTNSPHTVAEIAHGIAIPWQWFLDEGVGYPSLEQIEGSRIVLSQDTLPLDSRNLVSWWPFLLLGIVFYGLIPRMAGWIFAVFLEGRSLRDLAFNSVLHNPLWERMHSVALQSAGDVSKQQLRNADVALADEEMISPAKFQLWISNEIKNRYDIELLIQHLKESEKLRIEGLSEYTEGEILIESIDGATSLVLLEGWQAPIQEKLNQLKSMAQSRKLNGQPLYLLLIGKPMKAGWKTVKSEMVEIWRKKVRLLGIGNLHLLKDQVEGTEIS